MSAKNHRAVHLPVAYLPWTVGGREVFAHNLVRELRAFGWDVIIAIHQNLNVCEPLGAQRYGDIGVTVLPPVPRLEMRRATYQCAPDAVPGFERILQEFAPGIVHFHDFSIGANLLHLRLAKAYRSRIVMTYHSPGQSCLQRSLLYRGKTICDGRIDQHRCTECRLSANGLPALLGQLAASIPSCFYKARGDNSFSKAITARMMTRYFQSAWGEMIELVDVIHVYSDWVANLIRLNGVPQEKLRMIRTGVGVQPNGNCAYQISEAHHPLRLAYVGRCDEVKGVHVLVEAVCSLPETIPLEISFFGPYWDGPYGRKLLNRIGGDRRFKLPSLLSHNDVISALADKDGCVVPSLWLETGPLVVLEAFAAGIPVIGSRLGGIAELVRDNMDGLLFPPGDSVALAKIIRTLAENEERLSALKQGVQHPRSMREVARDMNAVYEELVSGGYNSSNSSGIRTV